MVKKGCGIMKILIVNSNLKTGGIRESLLSLVKSLGNDGHEVYLQLLDYDNEEIRICKKRLPELNVLKPLRWVYYLSTSFNTFKSEKNLSGIARKTIFRFISEIGGLKRTLYWLINKEKRTIEYDISIAYSNDIWNRNGIVFAGGCNEYVICKVKSCKKIAWIHSDPIQLGFTHDICIKTYEKFDSIVNVSRACKNIFDEIVPEYKIKSKVVYNMFDFGRINRLSNEESPYELGRFNIVTVARLDNQAKRIDKILSCCKELKDSGIVGFRWYIVGDGPDKEKLVSLSIKYRLNEIVVFEGEKKNPYPYMKYADVFVLTSDYESYGIVLIESLITGTPVITTNFPAAFEVVKNEKNGLIIDNSVESISNIIKMIFKQPNIICEMKKFIQMDSISNEVALKQFYDVVGY